MDKKVEEIHGQLIAFYPVYTDEGNMTRLIFNNDGQKLISKRPQLMLGNRLF